MRQEGGGGGCVTTSLLSHSVLDLWGCVLIPLKKFGFSVGTETLYAAGVGLNGVWAGGE